MKNKKTVFVLGAGASCSYGYPSGARLRELICFNEGFWESYFEYLRGETILDNTRKAQKRIEIQKFIDIFRKSSTKSVDVFMANNPKLSSIGKYIIAYEIFRYEKNSLFAEEAIREQKRLEDLRKSSTNQAYLWGNPGFLGGDWYFHLYNKMIDGLVGKEKLPDFSKGNISFITFNYDRSLEQLFYISLRNTFSEVSEEEIIQTLKQLKILHVYGQIAPLKWQNLDDYVDYKQQINESILLNASQNIKTIFEEKENPELTEAKNLIKQAEKIFFLGFGYTPENLEILKIQDRTKRETSIYGTAFGLESKEKNDIRARIKEWLPAEYLDQIEIGYLKTSDNMDCLKLLKNYL